MASLADIRKKIRSVKNTQKITSAMKMVAASKLRRAEIAIKSARPYAGEMGSLLRRVAARVPTAEGEAAHPLLEARPNPTRILVVVLTSDRGLCGGFNNNTLRMAERFIAEKNDLCEKVEVATIGRRGADYFRKRQIATMRSFPGVFDDLTFRRATELADGLAEEYVDHELDAVYLIYNQFKSAVRQDLIVEQVLPVLEEELPADDSQTEYIFEANQQDVLDRLLPRYVAIDIWRSLLESWASEQGARMSAMDNASRNAREMVGTLTLQFNRARQAAITCELMEIISGAEALKG
jgi:F-type H+-transporting ATPase subunit gamma